MEEESLVFNCNVANKIFGKTDDKFGMACAVGDSNGKKMGSFSINVKNINDENKIDFKISKDLLTNVIADNIKIDNIFDSLIKLGL